MTFFLYNEGNLCCFEDDDQDGSNCVLVIFITSVTGVTQGNAHMTHFANIKSNYGHFVSILLIISESLQDKLSCVIRLTLDKV